MTAITYLKNINLFNDERCIQYTYNMKTPKIHYIFSSSLNYSEIDVWPEKQIVDIYSLRIYYIYI